jgi:hypothetical protein
MANACQTRPLAALSRLKAMSYSDVILRIATMGRL